MANLKMIENSPEFQRRLAIRSRTTKLNKAFQGIVKKEAQGYFADYYHLVNCNLFSLYFIDLYKKNFASPLVNKLSASVLDLYNHNLEEIINKYNNGGAGRLREIIFIASRSNRELFNDYNGKYPEEFDLEPNISNPLKRYLADSSKYLKFNEQRNEFDLLTDAEFEDLYNKEHIDYSNPDGEWVNEDGELDGFVNLADIYPTGENEKE